MQLAWFLGAVVALALYLWLDYLVAREFHRVACSKGFWEEKYFWISFFLGIIGHLLVIALPDRGLQNVFVSKDSSGDNLPEL